MKDSLRMSRVNELLKQEVATLVEKYIERTDGCLLSITEVNTSPDLKHAKIYVSILGNQDKAKTMFKNLLKKRSFMQSAINKDVKLKYTPILEFSLDSRIEKGDKVIFMISEMENQSNN